VQVIQLKNSISFCALMLFWSGLSGQANAQASGPSTAKKASNYVRFGGEMGSLSEVYHFSGGKRRPRRPSATARLYFRPTLTLVNKVTFSANILFSTEGNSFGSSQRQSINQFGLSPAWGWGKANIGDFTDSYTRFTFSGIQVRGAGLHLTPGILRFSIMGGRAKRAVFGSAINGTFQRKILGGRLGVGKENGSYFDIIALHASDDISSLPPPPDTAFVRDPNEVGTFVSSFGVTPQENLVIAVASKLSLFKRKIVLKSELSGSAFTRDKRARKLDDEGVVAKIPSFVKDVFTPRTSTNVDFAYTSNLQISLAKFQAQAGYKYIGPGYISLGVGSLLVDKQEFSLKTSLRFRRASVSLSGLRQNDNLIHQKIFTTIRSRAAGTLNIRPQKSWIASFRLNYLNMGNDSKNDLSRVAYSNWQLGTGQTLMFQHSVIKTASLNYRYQVAKDKNPERRRSNFESHNADMRFVIKVTRNLTANPSVGLVGLQHPIDGWRKTGTFRLAVRHNAFSNRLATSILVGSSFGNGSKTWQNSFSSTFKLTKFSLIRFVIRSTNFRATTTSGSDFDEYTTRLSLSHRF
jgi:hypothetical protein